jgi:Superinfection immunity protein
MNISASASASGWAILIVLYFLPTIVAVIRHKRNALMIGIFNFLLGWSIVGYIVALVWAIKVEELPVDLSKLNQIADDYAGR